MPQRDDVHKILIIGSGPIVIGQACEFDYSGTQACKALRDLGYEVVLVNSNPATIMTDPVMADETFIEPLNIATLTKIIEAAKPDALLPNLGGQTALNLSAELHRSGVLAANDVQIIGISPEAIGRGEDRAQFKAAMDAIGIEMPRSTTVTSVAAAERAAAELGYPVVLRPAYTMGGTGGGLVYNIDELRTVCGRGLQASMVGQVLVEESVLGWEELELEVVRDAKGQLITVCFIENVDPMGVHTGDSYCTAPMLTVSEPTQRRLQDKAHQIVSAIGVIGGTNVQFAHDPATGRIVVIEINPRTSRSSALASKATGFPIARVSTLLAAGLTLDEIPYWRDGTLERYTPGGDYVVVKFARWAFEKFPGAIDRLGTQMRAVGEVMSIGKSYKESLGKAIRSLENGRSGLGNAADFRSLGRDELLRRLVEPSSERHYLLYEALRAGATVDELHDLTHIACWFLEQMLELVQLEEAVAAYAGNLRALPEELLRQAKADGFGDAYLAGILAVPEADVRARRTDAGIVHRYDAVPVSGVEDAEYYYSSYSHGGSAPVGPSHGGSAPVGPRSLGLGSAPTVSTGPVDPSHGGSAPVDIPQGGFASLHEGSAPVPRIMVLGGGPNRIGQGIEFDYCCVHAAYTLRDEGYETIMVNCNPETVSTDYDTSDRLYFEPLTVEDVLAIYERERPGGVVCQFGGQTPLNIAQALQDAGVTILGTSPETIDLAEDRDRFRAIMDRLGIPMPEAGMATTVAEALAVADGIGYPVIVRPSYVLGGRGMEIINDGAALRGYMEAATGITPERPILIDRFLENALECEADAIADGTDAFVPAVMEHIEYAGIHSGDSACLVPSVTIPDHQIAIIEDYTRRIAVELGVVGLMNIQYAIEDGTVYVLEANPRASRTVPLVSKVCDVNMARLATRVMLGTKLADLNLTRRDVPYYGAKEAVFPFTMFPEVDPLLGPEMRSTGEVLGLATDPGLAFFKAEEAAQNTLPTSGTVLMTIAERDRRGAGPGTPADSVLSAARLFAENGLRLVGTHGTAAFLREHGLECAPILKLHQGRPHMADAILNGDIQLVVNTPAGASSEYDDSYIRKAAIRAKVPYITTTPQALAAAQGIAAHRAGGSGVRSLQSYHATIR